MRILPLPEPLAPGRKWAIEPGDGSVSLTDRVIKVPQGPDDQSALVRAHEMAHIAFTPDGVSPEDQKRPEVQAVEDYRINRLAERAGVDFSAGGPSAVVQYLTFKASTQTDLAYGILSSLSQFPGPDSDRHMDAIKRHADPLYAARIKQAMNTVEAFLQAKKYSFDGTLAAANWIRDALHLFAKADAAAATKTARRAVAARRLAARGPMSEDKLPAITAPGGASYTKAAPFYAPVDLAADWGRLEKRDYPLRAPQGARGRLKIANTAEGSVFRAPQRLMTDGAVFRHITVHRRGTLLIDHSGSMALSAEQVKQMVARLPAGIIATYSGNGSGKGELRILARNGRMADEKTGGYKRFGGANEVDGPALQWLAAQPTPRVWISDGGVTGIGDSSNTRLQTEAFDIVARGRIIQLADIHAALKLFRVSRSKSR